MRQTKQTKQTKPSEVYVHLNGPMPDRYGSDYRTLRAEVIFRRPDRWALQWEHWVFRAQVSRHQGIWNEPYLGTVHWDPRGEVNADEALYMHQRLTAFARYIGKLPVRPTTLEQWLSCLFACEKVVKVDRFTWRDRQDVVAAPDERDACSTTWVVAQADVAWDRLVPPTQPALAAPVA